MIKLIRKINGWWSEPAGLFKYKFLSPNYYVLSPNTGVNIIIGLGVEQNYWGRWVLNSKDVKVTFDQHEGMKQFEFSTKEKQ